jgi:NitT/TauT family transport system substrate-binding protein
VRKFLDAVEKAVLDINADKTRWNDLLLEQNLIPEPVLPTYVLPDYPTAGVPNQSQFDDALAWLVEKGLAQGGNYSDDINPDYLP